MHHLLMLLMLRKNHLLLQWLMMHERIRWLMHLKLSRLL